MRNLHALLVGSLVACGAGAPTDHAAEPPAEERAPSPTPPPAPPSPLANVDAAATVPLDPALPRLDVGERAVKLGGRSLVTLDAYAFADADVRGGAYGYSVPAIVDALTAVTESRPRLVLAFDGATPYRTVARVVYSVGQAQRSELFFVVRVGSEERALPIVLPSLAAVTSAAEQLLLDALGESNDGAGDAPEREPTPTIDLTLHLRAGGLSLRTTGDQWMRPGCEDVTRDETFIATRRPDVLDWAALTTCLDRLATRFPDAPDAGSIQVAVEDDLWFAELASLIAKLRGTSEHPRFTDVRLGVAPR